MITHVVLKLCHGPEARNVPAFTGLDANRTDQRKRPIRCLILQTEVINPLFWLLVLGCGAMLLPSVGIHASSVKEGALAIGATKTWGVR